MSRKFLSCALALSCVSLFITGADFACAAAPAHKIVRVGFVHPQSPATATRGVRVFWDHLHELGYVEDQNLVIETRWAEGRTERLPALIAEVLASKVDVLVTYATQTTVAAKNATNTVPIVGVAVGDPISIGLAASVARPGGNVTGFAGWWAGEGIASKWVELLQETVPRLSHIAVIVNPDTAIARDLKKELQAAAPAHGPKLHFIEAREPATLASAFEQAAKVGQAILVLPSIVYSGHRWQVTALASKRRLPTIYYMRDFVDAGGLMSYGSDVALTWRRAADYVDKIVNGAMAGDLPFQQPTKLELVVNLQSAKALGITIPESILLRADEVIR